MKNQTQLSKYSPSELNNRKIRQCQTCLGVQIQIHETLKEGRMNQAYNMQITRGGGGNCSPTPPHSIQTIHPEGLQDVRQFLFFAALIGDRVNRMNSNKSTMSDVHMSARLLYIPLASSLLVVSEQPLHLAFTK